MTVRVADIPLWRRALYFGIVFLAVFVFAEGAVRLRAWVRFGGTGGEVHASALEYRPDWALSVPRRGYEAKGALTHVKINALGFRGADISPTKPPTTLRIACLGASTTFSAEASSNDAIWTALLQRQLQGDLGIPVEVVNAGVAGYTSNESLKYLKHRVLDVSPDLVIYYEANNEIARDTRLLAASKGLPDSAKPTGLLRAITSVSLLADIVAKNLAVLIGSRGSGPRLEQIPAALPEHFIGNLEQIRGILAERDVPLVLSTFIVKYRRSQDRDTQLANADLAFYYMPWMTMDGLLSTFDLYNQAILDYGAKAGLDVIDNRDVIPPDSRHFADYMHLTDQGNAVMAERFRQGLKASRALEQALERIGARTVPRP
jgi:lysophospholipase L1-like esterase